MYHIFQKKSLQKLSNIDNIVFNDQIVQKPEKSTCYTDLIGLTCVKKVKILFSIYNKVHDTLLVIQQNFSLNRIQILKYNFCQQRFILLKGLQALFEKDIRIFQIQPFYFNDKEQYLILDAYALYLICLDTESIQQSEETARVQCNVQQYNLLENDIEGFNQANKQQYLSSLQRRLYMVYTQTQIKQTKQFHKNVQCLMIVLTTTKIFQTKLRLLQCKSSQQNKNIVTKSYINQQRNLNEIDLLPKNSQLNLIINISQQNLPHQQNQNLFQQIKRTHRSYNKCNLLVRVQGQGQKGFNIYFGTQAMHDNFQEQNQIRHCVFQFSFSKLTQYTRFININQQCLVIPSRVYRLLKRPTNYVLKHFKISKTEIKFNQSLLKEDQTIFKPNQTIVIGNQIINQDEYKKCQKVTIQLIYQFDSNIELLKLQIISNNQKKMNFDLNQENIISRSLLKGLIFRQLLFKQKQIYLKENYHIILGNNKKISSPQQTLQILILNSSQKQIQQNNPQYISFKIQNEIQSIFFRGNQLIVHQINNNGNKLMGNNSFYSIKIINKKLIYQQIIKTYFHQMQFNQLFCQHITQLL